MRWALPLALGLHGAVLAALLAWPAATPPEPDEPVVINGALYVGRPDVLRQRRSFQGEGTLGWSMPPERGWDVDTAFDFLVCEALWPHVRSGSASTLDSVRR